MHRELLRLNAIENIANNKAYGIGKYKENVEIREFHGQTLFHEIILCRFNGVKQIRVHFNKTRVLSSTPYWNTLRCH